MDGRRVIWSALAKIKDGELNGRHENNSPKGWTDGQLNGRHEYNASKDVELNALQENNSPITRMAQE